MRVGKQLVYDLIRARGGLDVEAELNNDQLARPYDPIGQHASRSLSLAWSDAMGIGGDNSLQIGFKMIGHDFLDPLLGYDSGANVSFLQLEYRIDSSSGGQLQRFDLLDIKAYTPFNAFPQGLSWELYAGRREKFINGNRTLATTVSYALGGTYFYRRHLLYALGELSLDHQAVLSKHRGLETAFKLGALLQSPQLSYCIEYQSGKYLKEDFLNRRNFRVEISRPYGLGAVFAEFEQAASVPKQSRRAAIGYRHYF